MLAWKNMHRHMTTKTDMSSYLDGDPLDVQEFDDAEKALVALTTLMLSQLVTNEMVYASARTWAAPAAEQLYRAYAGVGANFSELISFAGQFTCILFGVRLFTYRTYLETGLGDFFPIDFCTVFANATFLLGQLSLASGEVSCYRMRRRSCHSTSRSRTMRS